MRFAALVTINEAFKLRYRLPIDDPEAIHENDKVFVRANILDAIKVNVDLRGFRKTYKEILYKVIQSDFPNKYLELINLSIDNLKSASNEKEVLSSLIPIKLLIGNYEMVLGPERKQLEALIPQVFPFLENYAMKFMKQGSGDISIMILTKILKCFLMCNYLTCEDYFQ